MKARIKRSIVWKISDEDFINLIKNSKTMSQVLAYFRLQNKGGNFKTCKARIKDLNLDTSHFLKAKESSIVTRQVTLEIFLKRLSPNSNYKNSFIKEKLIQFNLLDYCCAECGNTGEWNKKRLSLQLEHKNGISNDNTITNLQFLCPNCHSQTDTFAGKSLRKVHLCESCCEPIKKYNKLKKCKKCAGQSVRKIGSGNFKREYIRPTKEELEKLIIAKPISHIAKELSVSDNGIRKWCVGYGIDHKKLSKFSRGKEKPLKIIKQPASKYKYVSLASLNDEHKKKWSVNIKKRIDGKKVYKFYCRCDTELEAAQAVANYFNSSELILR